jgi:putative pyruvate formate lyase activating enzyme
MSSEAVYLSLPLGELRRRAEEAVAALEDCRLCPRDCGVNRLVDKWSACKTGRYAVVCNAFPHMGEESCVRGWRGSGTIFFGHCSLRCVFCQNADISQQLWPGPEEPGLPAESLAGLMLELQEEGVHNINWVSPTHVVPQLLEALVIAVEGGLTLPIVYNTGGYDGLQSLAFLDGVVDIYMPDLKTLSRATALRLSKAENYPDAATAGIREMHRQVGDLVIGPDGLAERGLLVRHLVLPGKKDETRAVLEWIASELGANTYVNLMDQYQPAYRVRGDDYAEIGRRISRHEFRDVVDIALSLGLERLEDRPAAWEF